MLKLIQCIIWLIIIPLILGMIPSYFIKKEKNNILYCFFMGYVIQFAVLQLISIPMIYTYCKLTTVIFVFCSIICILVITAIYINRKNLKDFLKSNFEHIKKLPVSTIFVVLIVLIQISALLIFAHIDEDDSVYVATATTMIHTNTLYEYTALEGYLYEIFPVRYVLAPFPIYTAIISKLTDIHPAIIAHTIFPVIFIMLAYFVYALIGSKLFKNDIKSVNLFLIILSILYIWGNYSIRSNFSFLLMRIWQGKAMLANIWIPAILFIFYDCISDNENKIAWIFLFITMLSSCLLTQMSLALAPMTLGIISLVFAIREKKISYIIKSGICCLPCITYMIMYLIIK